MSVLFSGHPSAFFFLIVGAHWTPPAENVILPARLRAAKKKKKGKGKERVREINIVIQLPVKKKAMCVPWEFLSCCGPRGNKCTSKEIKGGQSNQDISNSKGIARLFDISII